MSEHLPPSKSYLKHQTTAKLKDYKLVTYHHHHRRRHITSEGRRVVAPVPTVDSTPPELSSRTGGIVS